MKVSFSFDESESKRLDSLGFSAFDLSNFIDKAIPSIVKAYFKDALKKKGVLSNAKKKA